MRKSRPATIASRVLLALLVAFGMTLGSSLSAACSAETCGNACGMHGKASKPEPRPDCCAGKESKSPAKPAKGTECNCQIGSAPDAAPAGLMAVVVPIPHIAALPAPALMLHTVFVSASNDAITFSSDASPPDPVRHPDLGRAPPSA